MSLVVVVFFAFFVTLVSPWAACIELLAIYELGEGILRDALRAGLR